MTGCVCANKAKVAEILHPYCPAHATPEVEADAARWRAVAEMFNDPTSTTQSVSDAVALQMPREAKS